MLVATRLGSKIHHGCSLSKQLKFTITGIRNLSSNDKLELATRIGAALKSGDLVKIGLSSLFTGGAHLRPQRNNNNPAINHSSFLKATPTKLSPSDRKDPLFLRRASERTLHKTNTNKAEQTKTTNKSKPPTITPLNIDNRAGDSQRRDDSMKTNSGNSFVSYEPYQSSVSHPQKWLTHYVPYQSLVQQPSSPVFIKSAVPTSLFPFDWRNSPFPYGSYKKISSKITPAADIRTFEPTLESSLNPLTQTLLNAVKNGANKHTMLTTLETNTTKAEQIKAIKEIAEMAKTIDPSMANQLNMDMDAAEKAILSAHIYTLGKPMQELIPCKQQFAQKFATDSGWYMATPQQIKSMGLDPEDLTISNTNFLAQIYMPDKEVFGSDAKPVLVFKGTETIEDWRNNFQQAMNMTSQYYEQAVKIGKKLKKIGRSIEIAGHSLGGGMSIAASKASGIPTTTYNAAGLHNKTLERYGISSHEQSGDQQITGYQIEDELLTHLQERSFLANKSIPKALRNPALNTVLSEASFFPETSKATSSTFRFGSKNTFKLRKESDLKDKLTRHKITSMCLAIEDRKISELHTLIQKINESMNQ